MTLHPLKRALRYWWDALRSTLFIETRVGVGNKVGSWVGLTNRHRLQHFIGYHVFKIEIQGSTNSKMCTF